jgi:hypothetical protein
MEHVWVSAYVNWLPSRGAKQGTLAQHVNPNGTLNAWVPLDPSYKQYSYTAGLDLKAAVPLDPQALINAAQQGATVNASEGWVQNINQAGVQAELNSYQARLKTYIDGQNASATVGDVISKKIIPQQLPSLLAGSLPYAVVQTGQRMAAVPATLQHQFRIQLFNTQDAGIEEPTPVLSYQEKTSQLAGKRLTLSYVPATRADADLIASYLPKPHADGSPIQPSEFPSSLPGYLIKLKPQVSLDGQVVAQSSQALTMGTDLFSNAGFTRFSSPTDWDVSTAESHAVGQATALGLSLQGISAAQLGQLKSRIDATKSQLQANNLSGLTGEQVSGDLLTATIWSWFAAAESHNRLSQNQAGVTENPGLSYGLFHATAQSIYSWGVVRQVKFPGVNIDVPHVRNLTASKAANRLEWISYNRLRGQHMSAMEHSIPERLFNDTTKCNISDAPNPLPRLPACPQGVSAVKALGLAAQAGQRIYTITPQVYENNPSIVQDQLFEHTSDTQGRVYQALNAGYEVGIHQKPITQSGWAGAGIIFTDPNTGAGGYVIEGGSNGAALIAVGLLFFALAAATFPLGAAGGIVAPIVMAEIALGVGYILMGVGVITGKQDLVNNGACVAIAGAIGLAAALQLVGAAFALIAGVAAILVGAYQALISTFFPNEG